MRHALHDLMNRAVEVDAVNTSYRGILREVTEEVVSLWTDEGWLSIPHSRIKGLRPAPKPPSLARRKPVHK